MWIIDTILPIQIAVIRMENLQVSFEKAAFDKLLLCASEYAKKSKDVAIARVEGVHPARRLFHAIGIDPTKHRPSSEALLNRALKGKELYPVNTLVDVGNWCSLDFLLPICIYDTEKIHGQVTIRKGRANESYPGLNNQELNLYDRYVIADEIGAFGSPIKDSARTSVTEDTHQVILVIFAPKDYQANLLRQQADLFVERVQKFCGGDLAGIEILTAPACQA